MPDETRHESADLEDYDVQEPADSLIEDPGYDPLDRGVAPPERWSAGMRYGVTAEEQEEGESLDQLLAEEEPDSALDFTDDEPEDIEDLEERTRTRGTRTWTGFSSTTARIPGPVGWWPRTRAPTRTRRRIWSRVTPESMVAAQPRKRPRCTSWTTTTPTSAPTADTSAARRCRNCPLG